MKEIFMPRIDATMEEGKVLRWLKAKGDSIRKGEELLEIETDKTAVVLEAPSDGVLHDILVKAGTLVPVGTVLGVIAAPSEDMP